MNFGKQMKKI